MSVYSASLQLLQSSKLYLCLQLSYSRIGPYIFLNIFRTNVVRVISSVLVSVLVFEPNVRTGTIRVSYTLNIVFHHIYSLYRFFAVPRQYLLANITLRLISVVVSLLAVTKKSRYIKSAMASKLLSSSDVFSRILLSSIFCRHHKLGISFNYDETHCLSR